MATIIQGVLPLAPKPPDTIQSMSIRVPQAFNKFSERSARKSLKSPSLDLLRRLPATEGAGDQVLLRGAQRGKTIPEKRSLWTFGLSGLRSLRPHKGIDVSACICMYTHTHTYIYIYTHIYVCIYIYTTY